MAISKTTDKPTTVAQYLKALPSERRAVLAAIRKEINANLPEGYREGIRYGMVGWFVPHTVYPAGYHCDPSQPVPFVSLASQKNHMAVYLFCLYCDKRALARFQKRWKAETGRLDMGASCVRFKGMEQVSLGAIGDAVRAMPVDAFIAAYEGGVGGARKPASKKKAPKKRVTKKAATKKATGKKKAVGEAGSKKVSAKKAARKGGEKVGRRR